MLTSEMDEPRWRAFRLFLASLPEVELDVVRGQLDQEMTARRECETNAVRLFFSSLAPSDLEAARREIDVVCGKSAGSGSLGVRLSSSRAGHYLLAFRAEASDESTCANQPRQKTTMKSPDTTAAEPAVVAGQGALVAREKAKKAGSPKAQSTAKKAKREAKANKKEPRPKTSRVESKGAQILEMIGRAKGATLGELMKTTGWKAHSVRGFISVARKKHRKKIESSKNEAGDCFYKVAK